MSVRTFNADELERVSAARRARRADSFKLRCPRCENPLTLEPIPRPEAVSYVRVRAWVRCSGCGSAGVIDVD